MPSIVFFGSFQNYSAVALDIVHRDPNIQILTVITTPGSPVFTYCQENHLPVLTPDNFDTILNIPQPDFLVVCGYGKLLPLHLLNFPKIMAINVHQSLLPEYAGRFPAEWAILRGETQTGVTLIKMSPRFDTGEIIVQQSFPITDADTKETLYQKLYELSGQMIVDTLPKIVKDDYTLTPQITKGFYARQLTREDGYITSLDGLDRKVRALTPWPGVWTYVLSKDKRKLMMKILSVKKVSQKIEFDKVQIEGKNPTFWSEISQHYSLIK